MEGLVKQRLQCLVVRRERMMREEKGLGERSSNGFKGNKGGGRAEERKEALEKRKRLTVKQRWRRGTERGERVTEEKSRRRWLGEERVVN